jgi:ubiquinone/menaquinone biosynthesis C-methylase UbiE
LCKQNKKESFHSKLEPKKDPENNEQIYLERYIADLDGKILDIGCGDGRLTRSFAGKTRPVIGIDLDLDELKIANQTIRNAKLKNMYYAAALGESLPFTKNSFRQAIFSWSL